MVDTSDLVIFWNGFQIKFNEWYRANYAHADSYAEGFCWDDRIRNFCDVEFSRRHCYRYCDHPSLCRQYWTQQAKVCCESCGQDSCIWGATMNVEPICYQVIPAPATNKTTTTTTTTKKTTITTTRKEPVYTSSLTTTNAPMYTKQPFSISPYVSIPIGVGVALIFIAIYLLRKRLKRPTENPIDDFVVPSLSMSDTGITPCAPPCEAPGEDFQGDENSDNETDEAHVQVIFSTEIHDHTTYDSPPSYDDCIKAAPPSYEKPEL